MMWIPNDGREELKAGYILHDLLALGKLITPVQIKCGKHWLPGYKVQVLTGHEKGQTSFFFADQVDYYSTDRLDG